MDQKPLQHDPEFVQGQIDALHALVLALAQDMPTPLFAARATKRLQAARDALIDLPVSDARLAAIDSAMAWVRRLE